MDGVQKEKIMDQREMRCKLGCAKRDMDNIFSEHIEGFRYMHRLRTGRWR